MAATRVSLGSMLRAWLWLRRREKKPSLATAAIYLSSVALAMPLFFAGLLLAGGVVAALPTAWDLVMHAYYRHWLRRTIVDLVRAEPGRSAGEIARRFPDLVPAAQVRAEIDRLVTVRLLHRDGVRLDPGPVASRAVESAFEPLDHA